MIKYIISKVFICKKNVYSKVYIKNEKLFLGDYNEIKNNIFETIN